ncbi:MAG: MOSC domain-containing protein [Gammaproteobacteria bacterium]
MRVLSVNVGCARPLRAGARTVLSAIGKRAVDGAVEATALGLAGDEQADLSVHGGLHKAVYAYPTEHYPRWQSARREAGVSLFDETLPWGFLGENLSIEGLVEGEVWIGDRLRFAHCILRVTAPREPCHKFTEVMGMGRAARLMVQHTACGFYLAVEVPGPIAAGDTFALEAGPRGLKISDAFLARKLKHLR